MTPKSPDTSAPAEPETLSPLPHQNPDGVESLTSTTSRSIAWTMANFIATKVVSVSGQIIIARLLFPTDFGLLSMASTVTAFAGVLRYVGMRPVLMRRARRYHLLANPAFWMAAAVGLIFMAGILVIAPFAARFYRAPQLPGILIVCGIAGMLEPLTIIPEARLASQMRFKLLSVIAWITSCGQTLLTIIFAARGFGAYSFFLGLPFLNLLRIAILYNAVRPPIQLTPQFRRWRHMLSDSSILFLSNLFGAFSNQGDYMILGRTQPREVAGIYFFAFGLSTQAMTFLTAGLGQILLAALHKLEREPARQLQAFLRACRVLALVGMPLCFLQTALADPGIHIVFKAKWYDAIPVLQILSVGISFALTGGPAGALMNSHGRFRAQLIMSITFAAIFMAFVMVGAHLGAARSVAIAVTLQYIILSPINVYVAVAPIGGTWRAIFDMYAPPLIAGAAATLAAMAVSARIPQMPMRNWIRLLAAMIVFVAIYLPLARALAPEAFAEAAERFSHMGQSISRRKKRTVTT